VAELLRKIRRRGTAQFADLAWDADPNLEPYFDRYLHSAREMGFRCKIHADHQDPAVPIEMALRHRVLSIDHLEYAGESGRRSWPKLASSQRCGRARPPVRDACRPLAR
jgi:imidazolonepropionase-like amidohydrolase